jgi:nucleoside permease NupC
VPINLERLSGSIYGVPRYRSYLLALVPSRKSDITDMILRAMIAGNAACFLTGSIAGKILDKH